MTFTVSSTAGCATISPVGTTATPAEGSHEDWIAGARKDRAVAQSALDPDPASRKPSTISSWVAPGCGPSGKKRTSGPVRTSSTGRPAVTGPLTGSPAQAESTRMPSIASTVPMSRLMIRPPPPDRRSESSRSAGCVRKRRPCSRHRDRAESASPTEAPRAPSGARRVEE